MMKSSCWGLRGWGWWRIQRHWV